MYKRNAGVDINIIVKLRDMIHLYSDTSNKKSIRLEEIEKCKTVLENVCVILRQSDDQVGFILYNGFNLLLTKVIKATIDPNTLQDFRKELSFLEVLATSNK